MVNGVVIKSRLTQPWTTFIWTAEYVAPVTMVHLTAFVRSMQWFPEGSYYIPPHIHASRGLRVVPLVKEMNTTERRRSSAMTMRNCARDGVINMSSNLYFTRTPREERKSSHPTSTSLLAPRTSSLRRSHIWRSIRAQCLNLISSRQSIEAMRMGEPISPLSLTSYLLLQL